MVSFGKIVVMAALAAGLVTGCGSQSSQEVVTASPSASASTAPSASPTHVALAPCTTPQPKGEPVAITPRTDGIYVGTETGDHPVALRFYPGNEVYYGVGRTGTSISEMASWLNKGYSHSHGDITGPWTHDSSGAFSKLNTKGQQNNYSVWKYTGTTLNLHIVTTFGCTVPGTVREDTTFMTFVPDQKI